MIDTDKHEGHTPAPWTWRGETIDGDGEVNHTVCYMEHPHVNGEMNEADAQLIADAPLLLAEVKRLREGIEKALIPTDSNPIIHPLVKLCDLRKALKELIE
tara:strand:+ start:333 stop:635 length:303 start_codon:yes stop_codon:yes gene_type:complete